MPSDDPNTDAVNAEFSTGATTPETPGRMIYPIIFVSDLGSDGRLASPYSVDKDDFAKLMQSARPMLKLALSDPFASGPDWEFQLAFDSLKSFEPDSLLKQCPNAGWRLGIRDKIMQRRQTKIVPGDFENAVRAASNADPTLTWLAQIATVSDSGAPQPPTTGKLHGSSVLDMVDEPSESARITADVERLARDAADSTAALSGSEGAKLDQMLTRLDGELGKIVEAILKSPAVRRLETAWRSLKFIIDRIDFRDTGVKLYALDAPRDQAVATTIEHVITPAFDGDFPTPGLIVLDYGFVNTPADLALLDEIAQHAAGLPVPIAFSIDPEFFELKGWRLLKNLPNLGGMTDNWQYAKYRSLREQPYAKSLAPVIGRFVLRAPYAAKTRSQSYTHNEAVEKIGDLLWAGGHIALTICAARSFAKHGWPTRMFGAEAGKIEDLPVVNNPNDPQNPWGPGDLILPDRRLDEPPEFGLNVLMSVKNQDYCILLGGVSAARPVQTAEISKNQAVLEISLPYQQFSNLTSTYLSETLPSLRGLAPEKVQEKLLFGLAKLMGIREAGEMDAVQVGVGQHPEDATRTLVQIRLNPPGRIVPGGLQIEFGFVI